MKDLYGILKVSPNADQQDILTAFKKAVQFTNDKYALQSICKAYAVLGNESRKRDYDLAYNKTNYDFGSLSRSSFKPLFTLSSQLSSIPPPRSSEISSLPRRANYFSSSSTASFTNANGNRIYTSEKQETKNGKMYREVKESNGRAMKVTRYYPDGKIEQNYIPTK